MASNEILLNCLCGCRELDSKEVKRLYSLSAQGTLTDKHATHLLHKFLKEEQSEDKNETEQFLDIFEKCADIIQSDRILSLEVEQLLDFGLPYHLEKDLKISIQGGDKSHIDRCLHRIQGEFRNEIEASSSYKRYKGDLLAKMQK